MLQSLPPGLLDALCPLLPHSRCTSPALAAAGRRRAHAPPPPVQAQKFSVQKQLRRRFQRFMAEQGDYNSLLLTILRGMVRDAERAAALAASGLAPAAAEVRVSKERFEERAQEYDIADVDAFYNSAMFAEHKFSIAADTAHIVLVR